MNATAERLGPIEIVATAVAMNFEGTPQKLKLWRLALSRVRFLTEALTLQIP
nr:hypothetical protein [Rhizobium acidisoli]